MALVGAALAAELLGRLGDLVDLLEALAEAERREQDQLVEDAVDETGEQVTLSAALTSATSP